MNQDVKQRVVGAFVLLALALVFVPLVLDGGGNYEPTISSRIPPAPVVDIMQEPVAERPVIDADLLSSQSQSNGPGATSALNDVDSADDQNRQSQPVTESVPDQALTEANRRPALDELALPEGWSVRLGVFSNAGNAQTLTQRLLDAGYRAYQREMPGAQGMMTGVFVGPQVERAEANRLKERLQDEFQETGLVVRFTVETIP